MSFGAAGVAYGMLRLAGARLQPELTATADAWLLRARRATATADAFANEGMDVRPETIGPISPYHTLSGVHLVGALLADAMADGPAVDAGVEAFLDASAVPCSGRDVTLGRAGTALASLLALEGLTQLGDEPRQGLRACAEARVVQLWAELPPAETVANSSSWPNLGVAHGWAGLLYVTLRWLASLEEPGAHPLAESVRSRLEELAGCAWPSGRGMALPWRDRPGPSETSMPGWCNGAAGLVHVGCEARRVLGDERYLELAERAAWQAWESESLAIDLCCGLGGRAYALLELHRCGGGAAWRRKAERLALGAVRAAPEQRNAEHPRHSLLKGELGLALLCADLERPEVAAMPFFGREPLAIHHGQGGIERPGSRSGLQEEP
ncbi:MAG TPA: lanthionine synthetase LanC family protein [Geminicoccaceae bacterium]|nr:lanthionine synthetase LanC family protein [Geminicoccaceae bacterium]